MSFSRNIIFSKQNGYQISENIEEEKKFRFGGVKIDKIKYNRKK